ncbi:tight adherence pilus pseudopilin TadF [Vibrio rarus]|uniref:tight adherence pilus pseudopilin TadF n=1 Tax=Vibrio rarus TaxID=413403 RepID=UPI0021C3B003|nr:tight adherence pilus pseudopilin TadF [Vibrio rarus]
MINLTTKNRAQAGNFTVEFAIVGVVFALLLVFTSDLVVKLATHGKLDRMSFSAVSILKERTQFSSQHDIVPLTPIEVDNVYRIVERSLARTVGNFDENKLGFVVEEQRFNSNGQALPLSTIHASMHSAGCTLKQSLHSMQNLSLKSSWGRRFTLYRVTVCYQTENWFGDLVGKTFNSVSSSSVIMGR